MTEILVNDTFRAGLSSLGDIGVNGEIYQTSGRYSNLGFLSVGNDAQFNGSVTLNRDPTQALEAVTKRYVDHYGLEAGRPTSGAVPGVPYYATDTQREWRWSGFAWKVANEPWQNYTPANQGGFTLGTGTLQAQYRRNLTECEVRVNLLFGTGGSMGTDPHFDVPFQSQNLQEIEGTPVMLHDFNGANGGRFQGALFSPTADQGDNDIHFGVVNAAGTYSTILTMAAAVPFTWTVNDYLATRFTYQMF